MEKIRRYALYYAPRPGDFATAAASWLGWDLQSGAAVDQPDCGLPLAVLTAEPRKYGFHGTIKAPFRLGAGIGFADLQQAVRHLALQLASVRLEGLAVVNLHGFLAFVPQGPTDALQDLAADVVRALEPFRAPLTEAELAHRRPESLTPRQRDLLAAYGYPYVFDEFKFHLTLTGPVTNAEADALLPLVRGHFAQARLSPFAVEDLCLCAEDQSGRFHLLHRYPLIA